MALLPALVLALAPQELWSLYLADDRSPRTIGILNEALAESHPAAERMAADSILCHWGVPHALLPSEVYSGGRTLAEFRRDFAPPIEPLEGSAEERAQALRSPDEHMRAAAALGMILRREQLEQAADALVECGRPALQTTPPARNRLEPVDAFELAEWACKHLGSTYFAALGRHAIESQKDLCELLRMRMPGATAALPGLESRAAASAEARTALGPWIQSLLDSEIEWQLEHPSHRYLRPGDRNPDAVLSAHYLARATELLGRAECTYAELVQLHSAALKFPEVAALCLRLLPERVERDDEIGLESLGILGHLGCTDPRVRAAYIRRLNAWERFDDAGLDCVPFWKQHDEETRAAFLKLLGRLGDPYGVFEAICFAGELDASTSEIARTLIERTQGAYPWLVSRGFRGLVNVDAKAPLHTQMNQLALNAATKQARCEDASSEEARMVAILEQPYGDADSGGYSDYVQWGFFQAKTLGLHSPGLVRAALHYVELGDFPIGSGAQYEAATVYLESAKLEIAEHAALRRLRPPDMLEETIHGINLAERRYDGQPLTRLSLEDVPAWRRRIFAGEPQYFARLLRVTALGAREEPYFVALLERGSVEQRLWALGLVSEFEIRSPAVLACATRLAESDLDDSVRRAARRLGERRPNPR